MRKQIVGQVALVRKGTGIRERSVDYHRRNKQPFDDWVLGQNRRASDRKASFSTAIYGLVCGSQKMSRRVYKNGRAIQRPLAHRGILQGLRS